MSMSKLAKPALSANHDDHPRSHIRTDMIVTKIDPFRFGGGIGPTIGQRIDATIHDALDNGQRIARLSVVLTEEDWNTLYHAFCMDDDIAVKDEGA